MAAVRQAARRCVGPALGFVARSELAFAAPTLVTGVHAASVVASAAAQPLLQRPNYGTAAPDALRASGAGGAEISSSSPSSSSTTGMGTTAAHAGPAASSASFHSAPHVLQHPAVADPYEEDDDAGHSSADEREQQSQAAAAEAAYQQQQQASAPTRMVSEEFEEALRAEEGPIALYKKRRLAGLLRRDARQEQTIVMLQQLYERLEMQYCHVRRRLPSGLTMVDNVNAQQQQEQQQQRAAPGGYSGSGGEAATAHSSAAPPPSGGWWSKLASLVGGAGNAEDGARRSVGAPRGLYMYGGVGCGKTMLMDLLVDAAKPEFKLLRTHFHDFMLDVHSRLRKHSNQADPLTHVANDISRKTKVLCLDELFVTDVADAMILHRLFGRLWDAGLVLVATSNRAPRALYEGGLQRDLFLPFIDRLQEQCAIHDMESPTDYRRLAQHRRGLYFVGRPSEAAHPAAPGAPTKGPAHVVDGGPTRADAELDTRFHELTNNQPIKPRRVAVAMGRTLLVPAAGGCISRFDFHDLCGKPLGAADYIALANAHHTVALAGVPVFGQDTRAEAYRFVTLIDVMYEHRVRMVISAQGLPFELFHSVVSQSDAKRLSADQVDGMVVDDNLAFSKDRTVSRLMEMQSREYLIQHAKLHAPELLLALEEEARRHPHPNASPPVEATGEEGVLAIN